MTIYKAPWGSGTLVEQLQRRLYMLQRAPNKRKGFRVGHKTGRALLCAQHGVKNTGRQWTRLRRAIKRRARRDDAE
jgi:hypothetical protein